MPEMTATDLARIRAAVQPRDRCVRVAVERMEYRGQRVDAQAARTTYDAIAEIVRADERERVARYLERAAEQKRINGRDTVAPQFGEVEAMVLVEAADWCRDETIWGVSSDR